MNTENNTNTVNQTNNDVETLTSTAHTIFDAINNIASTMNDKDRMRVEDLAKKVSKTVSMDVKDVLGFINLFGKKSTVAHITRGANGGFVKGQKPVKMVKSGKKTKSA